MTFPTRLTYRGVSNGVASRFLVYVLALAGMTVGCDLMESPTQPTLNNPKDPEGTGTFIPDAPSGLSATVSEDRTVVTLSWTDNSGYETGYEVQRRVATQTYATLATLSANAKSFSDTFDRPGTVAVQYRVRACSGNSCSTWLESNSVLFNYSVDVETLGEGKGSVLQRVVQAKLADHPYGSVVELTATPQIGSIFTRWGGDLSGTNPVQRVTVTRDFAITATFDEKTFPLTVNVSGGGAVSEQVITAKSTDYPYGTRVRLTGVPNTGWQFSEWSGDTTGIDNPIDVVVDTSKTVTATFTRRVFTLTTSVQGPGTIQTTLVSGQARQGGYQYESVVRVTAQANSSDYTFSTWTGDLVSKVNPLEVKMDSNITLMAVFTLRPIVLETILAYEIGETSATAGGVITDNGGASVTARGVVWSTQPDPVPGQAGVSATQDGSGNGTFTSTLTGLTKDTRYYYRAYATNSRGTFYGSQASFKTTPLLFLDSNPKSGDELVAQDADITLSFDSPVDSASTASIRILADQAGEITGQWSGLGTRDLTFTPDDPFLPSDLIRVNIARSLQGSEGGSITQARSIEFSTASAAPVESNLADSLVTGSISIPWVVVPFDVDGDGTVDVVTASSSNGILSWYRNDGQGSFTPVAEISTGLSGIRSVTAGDVDADGDVDLLVSSYSSGIIRFYENAGDDESFSPVNVSSGMSASEMIRLADMDGDGDLDILFSNSGILYAIENLGVAGFGSLRSIVGVSQLKSMQIRDLDQDGLPDLVLTSDGSNAVIWMKNNGSWSFTSGTIANGVDARDAEVVDLDGDGNLDIIVADYAGRAIYWYENDGRNTFTRSTLAQTTYYPWSLDVADLDGDGDLDIVYSHQTAGTIEWLENDGAQQFTNALVVGGIQSVYDLSVTDMDGDGDGDILAALYNQSEVRWYSIDQTDPEILGASLAGDNAYVDVVFSEPVYSSSSGTGALQTADFYLNFRQNGGTATNVTLSAIRKPNGETTSTAGGLSGGETVVRLFLSVTGEISGKETLELNPAAGNAIYDRAGRAMDVLQTTGEVSLVVPLAIETFFPLNGVADVAVDHLIDFTFNQPLDSTSIEGSMLVTGSISGFIDGEYAIQDSTNLFFIPDRNFHPGETVSVVLRNTVRARAGGGLSSPATFDFQVEVPEVAGDTVLTSIISGAVVQKTTDVALGDLDGDGDLDLVSSSFQGILAQHIRSGNGYSASTITSAASGSEDIQLVDVDLDGDLDVVSANFTTASLTLYTRQGAGYSASTIATGLTGVFSVFARDLDLDGDIDLTVAISSQNRIRFYLNDGEGGFTAGTTITGQLGTQRMAVAADIDNDGYIDIVSAEASGVVLYRNNGNHNVFSTGSGGYSVSIIQSGVSRVYDLKVADMDQDGNMDVVAVLEGSNSIRWYEQTGTRQFTTRTIATASQPVALHVGDLDGDGDLDVITANKGANEVALYRNNGSQSFTKSVLFSKSNSSPYAIEVGDVDEDGDVDVVASLFDGDEVVWFTVTPGGEDDGSQSQTVTDIDGNTYATVQIGDQVWMAENLKVSRYRDGSSITNVTDNTQWSVVDWGAWAYYDNTASYNTPYGLLYNWFAITDSKGICPTGWSVPTDSDFTELSNGLGGNVVSGGKLKQEGTQYWASPNTGATNESGFTALPGGWRTNSGSFVHLSRYGFFWSLTSAAATTGKVWYLDSSTANLVTFDLDKRYGNTVRCLKD